MRETDVQHARAELVLLRGMLASIPADSKFGRKRLEQRIAKVAATLDDTGEPDEPDEPG